MICQGLTVWILVADVWRRWQWLTTLFNIDLVLTFPRGPQKYINYMYVKNKCSDMDCWHHFGRMQSTLQKHWHCLPTKAVPVDLLSSSPRSRDVLQCNIEDPLRYYVTAATKRHFWFTVWHEKTANELKLLVLVACKNA